MKRESMNCLFGRCSSWQIITTPAQTIFLAAQMRDKSGEIVMYYPRLRDLREDHDLKQKEVAAVLGIDQRVYSNYETGKREIPVHLLIVLAEYYQTSLDYLNGRTNDPKG